MSVKDIDRGWRKMMEQVSIIARKRDPVVAVGVQGAEAEEIRDEQGEITGVVLAGVHEFGREDGSIPERSFIRATVDANRDKYEKLQSRLLRLFLQGKLSVNKALSLLGEKVQSDIQRAMEKGLKPELSEATKKRRIQGDGSKVFKPLIDTGQLKQSITYEVRE